MKLSRIAICLSVVFIGAFSYGVSATDVEALREGNAILAQHARRILNVQEAATPLEIAGSLQKQMDIMAEHGHKNAVMLLQSEVEAFKQAAEALQELNRPESDLPYRLARLWTVFESYTQSKSEKNRRNYAMAPEELAQEARLQLIEEVLRGWLVRMDSLGDFNPETMEFFAYGFSVSLLELENVVDNRGRRLFSKLEISDVLNRFLVSSEWLSSDVALGSRGLELINKLLRFEGLVPYLKLLLAARAGVEDHRAPSVALQVEYAKLGDTLTFLTPTWNGALKVPSVHKGSLKNEAFENVGRGVQYIDRWFASHGFVTRDWKRVKGTSLEEQRSHLAAQRSAALCELNLVLSQPF